MGINEIQIFIEMEKKGFLNQDTIKALVGVLGANETNNDETNIRIKIIFNKLLEHIDETDCSESHNKFDLMFDLSIEYINSEDQICHINTLTHTIQISKGFINKYMLTDDEVAFCIGHEIGHYLLQQRLNQYSNTNVINQGKDLYYKNDKDGEVAFNHMSELICDELGIKLMSRAGFDPTSSISFFKKTQISENGYYSRTHPDTKIRIQNAKKHIKN